MTVNGHQRPDIKEDRRKGQLIPANDCRQVLHAMTAVARTISTC